MLLVTGVCEADNAQPVESRSVADVLVGAKGASEEGHGTTWNHVGLCERGKERLRSLLHEDPVPACRFIIARAHWAIQAGVVL